MNKIYIASSFKNLLNVERLSKLLESYGFEITVKWWEREYEYDDGNIINTVDLKELYEDISKEEFYSRHETRMSYESDKKGIEDCDIFIFCAMYEERKYNGANIELGIAIANNKKLFSIGELERSVLYHPVIQCKGSIDLIKKLLYYRECLK